MIRRILTTIVVSTLTPTLSFATATITVINADGPGEGFNDPTAFTPVGGNTATTVGQARLNAFQHAANIWGGLLNSSVEVLVEANFDPLPCDASSAVLGGAGPNTVHWDFPNAPLANTLYPEALANALAGVDQSPSTADIGATFNSDLDLAGCLSGVTWYYGLDGNPGSNQIDFVTVVLHEIGHGLGFASFVDDATGQLFLDRNDVYMLNLEEHGASPALWSDMNNSQRAGAAISDPNLHWVGAKVIARAPLIPLTNGVHSPSGHVRMHGPDPLQQGSSVSHFSTALSPNELMEPFYTGPDHDPSLALDLMHDIGWPVSATDSDGDGVPDSLDVCPGFDDNIDTDGDGVPDGCDICPGGDDAVDSDGDGVPDFCDICSGFDDNLDADGDGVPDGCDICPGGDDAVDSDADGVPDFCDVCSGFDDNVDTDGDGVPDGCDICPGGDDAVDSDGDGVPDFCDICSGFDDNLDADGDGVPDGCDICPGGDDAVDSDGDGVPNFCDICSGFDDNIDADNDGVPDGCDNCPADANPDQLDSNGNGIGDVCDSCCDLAGDANDDGSVNISDVTFIISLIFSGGSAPPCNDQADADGSNSVNIADATFLIDRIFGGGPPPICGDTGM